MDCFESNETMGVSQVCDCEEGMFHNIFFFSILNAS